jgi:hypothetical protein
LDYTAQNILHFIEGRSKLANLKEKYSAVVYNEIPYLLFDCAHAKDITMDTFKPYDTFNPGGARHIKI